MLMLPVHLRLDTVTELADAHPEPGVGPAAAVFFCPFGLTNDHKAVEVFKK